MEGGLIWLGTMGAVIALAVVFVVVAAPTAPLLNGCIQTGRTKTPLLACL